MRVNQGELCLIVAHSLLNKHGGEVSLSTAMTAAEIAGWQHSLTTFEQKRKHWYEVLRVARKKGLTTARLVPSARIGYHGDYIVEK